MDNDRYGIRVTGEYATCDGREYLADEIPKGVWLYTDDDPLPTGFKATGRDWIAGEQLVAKDRIQRKVLARTTCEWRGHPFTVGIIVGDLANIYYLGKDFDTLVHLPGMERPDKYEVQGKVPVSELENIKQVVEDAPLQPSLAEGTPNA